MRKTLQDELAFRLAEAAAAGEAIVVQHWPEDFTEYAASRDFKKNREFVKQKLESGRAALQANDGALAAIADLTEALYLILDDIDSYVRPRAADAAHSSAIDFKYVSWSRLAETGDDFYRHRSNARTGGAPPSPVDEKPAEMPDSGPQDTSSSATAVFAL
jgi:hypothetical protein